MHQLVYIHIGDVVEVIQEVMPVLEEVEKKLG